MAHGLLTATLPTKIGGDINFIAQEMNFYFLRPVFSGDTVRCEVKVLELEPGDRFLRMTADCMCRNQDGKEVMRGVARGVIKQDP
jgi:acyl dehydratase